MPNMILNCIICKSLPSRRSYSTSERLRSSQFLIVFKLFDILKIECEGEGTLCEDCYMLLDKVDCLGTELQAKSNELKFRLENVQDSDVLDRGSKRKCNQSSNGTLPKYQKLSPENIFDSLNAKDEGDYNAHKAEQQTLQTMFKTPVAKNDAQCDDEEDIIKSQTSPENIFVTPKAKNETKSEDDVLNEIDNSDEISAGVMSEDLLRETKNEPQSDCEDDEQNEKVGEWLNPDNIDSNVTFTKTSRGADQLIYQDYLYQTVVKVSPTNKSQRWRCILYRRAGRKGDCPGSIRSSRDGSFVFLNTKVEHNHPPSMDKINGFKFRDRLRQIVVEHPQMKAAEVVSFAHLDYPDGLPLKLSNASIMRSVQRIKKRLKKKSDEGGECM